MIQRVCELFMNNILYFCEQLEISIWQHCILVHFRPVKAKYLYYLLMSLRALMFCMLKLGMPRYSIFHVMSWRIMSQHVVCHDITHIW